MAGIQISGLLSNQAFDWKSVVDQLIAAESIPIKGLQDEKTANDDKITALSDVRTALESLQDSLQSIRVNSPFKSRAVLSSDAASTWKATSSAGAPLGSYKIAVSQLATASSITGTSNIGGALSASSDVSGVTLQSMNTALAITKVDSTFTVNGAAVNISPTDSLQAVFTKISDATGGTVTAQYNPDSSGNPDTVTLTSSTGSLVLGAANDTSNFLQVMRLANNGTGSATSSGSLGVVKMYSPLVSSGLATMPTAVDGSGKGTFTINGVGIDYNINNDSLSAVMARINASSAGVTASYDTANDRLVLTNKTTGDIGIGLSEAAGGLLAAFGVYGQPLARGHNAKFTINDGPELTSSTNSLDESVTGIAGLGVTVNSEATQTLSVQSDTGTMQTAIQDFLDKFNAVQDIIEEKTKTTSVAGKITTSVLSGNHEIQEWARSLQRMAFDTVSGVTGSIQNLDNLGIDFDGITGHLKVVNEGKLNAALANKPDDVQGYFSANGEGQVPQMYGLLTNLMTSDGKQQETIRSSSKSIDAQIATLQTRLDNERETLTNAFIRMLNAQSTAQSQNQAITNAFFKNNN